MLSFINNIKIIRRTIDKFSLQNVLCDENISEATKYLVTYKAILLCEKELIRCFTSLRYLESSIEKNIDKRRPSPLVLEYMSCVNGLLKIRRTVRLEKEFSDYTYDMFLKDYQANYFEKLEDAYLKENKNTFII